jgi:hypothetical protein
MALSATTDDRGTTMRMDKYVVNPANASMLDALQVVTGHPVRKDRVRELK